MLYRTVGKPQRGTEVLVADDDGHIMPAGTVGRSRVNGRGVTRGYWRDAEHTKAALSDDGWLMSSDLGYCDDAGNLVLVGRRIDMYIYGGYNWYPLEVENVLVEHPGVAQASVVGLASSVIGEIGVDFVVPLRMPCRRRKNCARGARRGWPITKRWTGWKSWASFHWPGCSR